MTNKFGWKVLPLWQVMLREFVVIKDTYFLFLSPPLSPLPSLLHCVPIWTILLFPICHTYCAWGLYISRTFQHFLDTGDSRYVACCCPKAVHVCTISS